MPWRLSAVGTEDLLPSYDGLQWVLTAYYIITLWRLSVRTLFIFNAWL